MSAWVKAAYIAKTKHLNGELVMHGANGLPFLLSVGMHVHIVPPSLRGVRQTTVESIAEIRDGEWLVSLKNVESIDSAEDLCGRYCLVRKDEIVASEDALLPVLIEGYSVIDHVLGYLGTVKEVLDRPQQPLLVVEHTGSEILIPIVDAFIKEVDETAEKIYVHIPKGLVE